VAGSVRDVTMRWREKLLFEGGAPGRPAILVDGDGAAATSPVELLLLAAATCSASDVVVILQKQRVALRSLEVAVRGTRRETEVKARRAIDLSLEKYCSVVASLAPDTRITYDVALR